MTGRPDPFPLDHPLLPRLGALADREGVAVFVVGGYVRDALLGRPGEDLDILVLGDGIAFARAAAAMLGAGTVVPFERFGTAMVPVGDGTIEFVGARREEYDPDSRKPVVRPGSLEDDLARRDFTVNAMAAGLHREAFGQLFDPFDGRGDLRRRILRTPREPERTFADDPLRILRAARFAARLQFSIASETRAAMERMRDRLAIVSQERITQELLGVLRAPKPSTGLRLMFDTGVLQIVFPEIAQMAGVDQRRDQHHKDVFLHTCQVLDNISETSDDVWLRFVALVHDIAKPRTKAFREGVGWTFHGHEEVGARMMKKLFQRLRLPHDRLGYVEKLVRLHLRPMVLVDEIVTDSAVRRLMVEAGEQIDDLMRLCRADITSKNPALVARYLRNYDLVMEKIAQVEEKDRLRSWQPPVRGEEIMEVCGIPPGRKVGELKRAVEEAILDGRIPDEHDAALRYLLSVKDGILGRE